MLNDPIHQKNFTNYLEKLPFEKDKIELLIKNSFINKNPKFYLEYASLFKNSFKFEQSEEKIKLLNIAGYFSYNYSLLLDTALDKNTKHNTIVLSNIFLEESIKILSYLFGLDKKFWGVWNSRKNEVFEASRTGKKMFKNEIVTLAEYEILCDSKSALGKIALDSLLILNQSVEKENHSRLMKSHKYFSVGFQISDDVEDFVEDYENEEFNIAYYKFVIEQNRTVEDIRQLNKRFYISNTASDLYKLAITYFQKALVIAQEVGENTWLEAIKAKIKETEHVINSIEEYLLIINTKVSLKKNAIKINSFNHVFDKKLSIEKGLNYLTQEWEKNYPEIKHIMVLSNSDGFDNNKTLHITDIFQRGIITNNLIDIGKSYKIDLSQIINFEINYLIQNRNTDEIGCWSYFPSVKEIAQDADDLGQMMQVFKKYNKSELINFQCLAGVKILLEDCYNAETGGMQTWIIPKENLTQNQKTQRKFNLTKWGAGPDIDVMGNFLYALCIYDFEKYKEPIEKGTAYIYSKIEKKSFWNSRWYYGWQYGTMICVRLAIELIKHNPSLENQYSNYFSSIRSYLIKNQNPDGGWALSITSQSDSLNTSLALSTLMLFDKSYKDKETLIKGINFLGNKQEVDGSWEAVHFIKPKVNEPYKSKGITTSYVLNTLTTFNAK